MAFANVIAAIIYSFDSGTLFLAVWLYPCYHVLNCFMAFVGHLASTSSHLLYNTMHVVSSTLECSTCMSFMADVRMYFDVSKILQLRFLHCLFILLVLIISRVFTFFATPLNLYMRWLNLFLDCLATRVLRFRLIGCHLFPLFLFGRSTYFLLPLKLPFYLLRPVRAMPVGNFCFFWDSKVSSLHGTF